MSDPGAQPGDGALRDVLAALARRRRLVLGLPLVLALVTVVVTLLLPRTWSATVVFMPEKPSMGRMGGLAGVASQLGIQLPFGDLGLSPLFYAELLRSKQFLSELAESPVAADSASEPRPLMDHLKVKGKTEPLRRERAAERLKRLVDVRADEAVGLVHVEVRMRSARLAQDVGARIVTLINEFNGERRRTRAKAEREYSAQRADEALDSLRQAEARLLAFVTQNRDVASAPTLLARRDQLQREVQLRQTLYQTLRQAYDQARLEEVRNTPTVTVVEDPQLPARPDSRKLIAKVALALAVGLLLGASGALWLEHRAARGRWGGAWR